MSILVILVCVALLSAAAGLLILLAPDASRRRLDALAKSSAPAGPAELSGMARLLAKLPASRANADNADTARLRMKFLNAGLRNRDYRLLQTGPRIVLALLFAGAALLTLKAGMGSSRMLAVYVLLAAIFGSYLPNLLLDRKIRQRQRAIFEAFPDAADLLLICVEAGLGLDAALEKVARELKMSSAVMAEELHLCRLELRAGATLEQSLKNLASRTGVAEVSSFAIMLTQADTMGVSIGDSLRLFSDDLRHQRLARAEELAAKVPTKMLFPLVLCIFPATFLVLLGPAVLQIIRAFKPLVSGS